MIMNEDKSLCKKTGERWSRMYPKPDNVDVDTRTSVSRKDMQGATDRNKKF